MSDHAAHANSFGPAAATYERGRPSYPSEALDWLLPAGRHHGSVAPTGHADGGGRSTGRPDGSEASADREGGSHPSIGGRHGSGAFAGREGGSHPSTSRQHRSEGSAGREDDGEPSTGRREDNGLAARQADGEPFTGRRQGGDLPGGRHDDTGAAVRGTAGWLPRVVDLGAGTGKLTRQIAARGLPVTAVDPSPGMLAELRRAVPGITAVQGTAESLPLPPASADVVLVAQAWHWVDAARAVPEIARVLSPGGRLGLLWNVRDESADWVRRLGEIIGSENSERSTIGPPFGESETARFRWTEVLGPERLIDMVASRSRIILLPPDEKAAVLNEVRRLMATHPDLVGRTEYELPYITECTRADLPTE